MNQPSFVGTKRPIAKAPRFLARRSVLKRTAAISAGAAIGLLLDACGGSATPTTAPAPTTAGSPTTSAAASTTVGATATRAAGTTGTAAATTAASPAASIVGTRTSGSSPAGTTTAARSAAAPSAATAPAASGTASGSAQETTAKIVAAANMFLGTLNDAEKKTVQFDWSNTAQKQRWSNFPPAGFQRAGLMWGNMGQASQNAWLATMQAILSAEGYTRVNAEWNADDALLAQQGTGGGFGRNNYYLALIGTPSVTSPWQWQWGGHHVTVNATIVGPNISLTPSFIGAQPATYTDTSGKTVRPLGDIEDEGFALINALDATQQKAAILGANPIDLVLGPGQDGKTIQAEGLPASQMNATQQAAFLKLINHYAGLGTAAYAAGRMAEIQSGLSQTHFAWYGPTTKGSAAYFRITGPTIVIEYSPQGGGGPGGGNSAATTDHIHGIYRDPTNDYGAKYTK